MSATPMVAPVRHCVVETGRARRLASKTVMAAPSSIEKPRVGLCCVIRLPSERMICYGTRSAFMQATRVICTQDSRIRKTRIQYREEDPQQQASTVECHFRYQQALHENISTCYPHKMLASSLTSLPSSVSSCPRTNCVRHIVRTMCNRHQHSRRDLSVSPKMFDSVVVTWCTSMCCLQRRVLMRYAVRRNTMQKKELSP